MPLLSHAAQKSPACFRAATWFAVIAHRGCCLPLPITERPGHAYSEMFPASPLPLSSKRLLPSVPPSAGPQHVLLIWLCHANPFMPSLAWIPCLFLTVLIWLHWFVCVCVILQCDAMKCCIISQNLMWNYSFKQPSYSDWFFVVACITTN